MSKLRMLVADDEEGIRESLRLILSQDYDMTFAEDGQQAWDQLVRGRFDLALLDIKMPKLDGLDILRRLKQQQRQQQHIDTPILMLTAYQSIELAKEAVKLGARDYVPKPFDREQVVGAIRDVVAKR